MEERLILRRYIMKKLFALSVVLAMFALAQTSYGGGGGYVVVYKGTIKASKTIVDVNDTNSVLSSTIKGYWALAINSDGTVSESNGVIYDAKKKYYKITQDASTFIPPVDPCNVRILAFSPGGEGILELLAVGKCSLTKVYADSAFVKKYVPKTLNGGGFLGSYAFFDPAQTYTGAMTISMIFDSKLTLQVNSPPYPTVDTIIDTVIVPNLIAKDPSGWTNWPGEAGH
jgi:hypothetical protein